MKIKTPYLLYTEIQNKINKYNGILLSYDDDDIIPTVDVLNIIGNITGMYECLIMLVKEFNLIDIDVSIIEYNRDEFVKLFNEIKEDSSGIDDVNFNLN